MILDHRTYTVAHGRTPEYLVRFERDALPVMQRYLGGYVGTFLSDIGPLNQVIHIWSYADIADREARRAALDADPEWQRFKEGNVGTFVQQENKILKCAPFSALR